MSAQLAWPRLVAFAADLFEQGYFFDWSTTDWFCVRVLDPLIVQQGLEAAAAIARWRHTHNLWQRRAAIVSFRHASTDLRYYPLIDQIIADLVEEQERFIQTGIGWVLADLSKPYPKKQKPCFEPIYLS